MIMVVCVSYWSVCWSYQPEKLSGGANCEPSKLARPESKPAGVGPSVGAAFLNMDSDGAPETGAAAAGMPAAGAAAIGAAAATGAADCAGASARAGAAARGAAVKDGATTEGAIAA